MLRISDLCISVKSTICVSVIKASPCLGLTVVNLPTVRPDRAIDMLLKALPTSLYQREELTLYLSIEGERGFKERN